MANAVKTPSQNNLMTEGSIVKSLLLFALPLIFGNLLQQLYNTADAIIVGKFVGKEALAAADGEGQEWRAMYPEMAETARREGFPHLARQFELVAAVEKAKAQGAVVIGFVDTADTPLETGAFYNVTITDADTYDLYGYAEEKLED